MAEDGSYSHDPGAIESVANDEMEGIARDVEESCGRFMDTGADAEAAMSGTLSFTIFGDATFAGAREKWDRASAVAFKCMGTSQARVDDAAEALRRTAEEYREADLRAAAEIRKVLRFAGQA